MNKGMTKYKLYIKHFRICIERNYTFVSSGFTKKKITCVYVFLSPQILIESVFFLKVSSKKLI